MGKASQDKGKRGEREAAAELNRLFNLGARRGVQYQGGPGSPDVTTNLENLHIEVKRTERLALWQSLQQAWLDADGKPSMVLHRPNGKPWIAVIRLDDLPQIIEELSRGPVQ